MNDDHDKPLNPVGDDALEARLTAWVLGEASPFEAAELEALCARDPAVKLLAGRLRVLHGLLLEDAKAGPDERWKLPAEKRAKIHALFGEETGAEKDAETPEIVSIRRTGRRALMAVAACTVISAVGWNLFSSRGARPGDAMAMQSKSDVTDQRVTREVSQTRMEELSKAVAAQTEVVEAKRRSLARSIPSEQATTPGGLVSMAPSYAQLEQEKAQLMAQIDALSTLDKPDLAYASGFTVPHEGVQKLLPEFQEANRDLLALKSRGLAEAHPEFKSQAARVSELREGLDNSVSDFRNTLNARLEETNAQMAQLSHFRSNESGSSASPLPNLKPAEDASAVADAAKAPGNYDPAGGYGHSGLAQKEMIRRQNAVAASDKLREEGREAYSKGDYQEAVVRFRESLSVLPDAPMTSDRRGYLNQLFADGASALGEQYRKVGKYDEARQLAGESDSLKKPFGGGEGVQSNSDDPIRNNPALAFKDKEEPAELRRKLQIAEGNYNLGKLDEANEVYGEALRLDPYNMAARRGMERVAKARPDYYPAAYDQTRAHLLFEGDSAWEKEVPADKDSAKEGLASNNPRGDDKIDILTSGLRSGQGAVTRNAIDAILSKSERSNLDGLSETGVPASPAAPPQLIAPSEPASGGSGGATSTVTRAKTSDLAALPEPMGYKAADQPTKDLADGDPFAGKTLGREIFDTKDGGSVEKAEAVSGLLDELQPPADAEVAAPESESLLKKAQPLVALQLATPPPAALETATASEPVSTFSLHVSDASFRMAKAALDRGEVPAPESIRVEEFYNAFDYGDPAPSSGEPVACAIGQAAHPILPQRNLLRIGVKTGAQGRGASTPLHLTLLLDSSGSMEREDRQASLGAAVKQLATLLKAGDRVSVIGFSRQPRLLVEALPGDRAGELANLMIQTPAEGGTNLEEGLKLAAELALRHQAPGAQNRVVLFTDGAANLGDATPESLHARVVAMRQAGIAFDAAGFGTDGLNDRLLERLTRDGDGRYYIVDGPEDAGAGFARQLAGAFRPAAENVKVQVRFNPARVARYRLIGFEEHRLNEQDFRDDAVDAAELAAEEAGNALYQVEALPQGEGELGEVSVRFRDPATGSMVERSWTLRYDLQAPPFDQAEPSLQLAGLAALAAEKLRREPMAAAVDFQTLAPVIARVKAAYPNSEPRAELEAMIGKLK